MVLFGILIGGGDNEYIRGEFQKEYNEETGKDETKLANLSLYLRKDMEHTDFREEFINWCEDAMQSEINGEISTMENIEKLEEEPEEAYESDELKKIVGYKFRGLSNPELDRQEIVYGIAFDRGWASPKKANELIDKAIYKGFLKEKNGKLMPTFDLDKLKYSLLYSPDVTIIETGDD